MVLLGLRQAAARGGALRVAVRELEAEAEAERAETKKS
jgi:hypothetical protein